MRYFFRALDFLVDHWEQLRWIDPGVALLVTWLFGWWARFSMLPAVEIATVALVVMAATLAILTLLPQYLRQHFPRPFAVSVSSVVTTDESRRHNIEVYAYVINRSPRNRILLEFSLCYRTAEGEEHWSWQPESQTIKSGLGPEKHTEGIIAFHLKPVEGFRPTAPNEVYIYENREEYTPTGTSARGIYLDVVDRLSGRHAHFRIPGTYPSNFFIP
jgi:hypothetical protein